MVNRVGGPLRALETDVQNVGLTIVVNPQAALRQPNEMRDRRCNSLYRSVCCCFRHTTALRASRRVKYAVTMNPSCPTTSLYTTAKCRVGATRLAATSAPPSPWKIKSGFSTASSTSS
jgi:hypothetical protein